MQITLDVPSRHLVDTDPGKFGERVKLYAAILMFQAGELSAGAACELAGVDRFSFAAECRRHGVALVDYPEDELEAELGSSPIKTSRMCPWTLPARH